MNDTITTEPVNANQALIDSRNPSDLNAFVNSIFEDVNSGRELIMKSKAHEYRNSVMPREIIVSGEID
jgi:hypothetical protein